MRRPAKSLRTNGSRRATIVSLGLVGLFACAPRRDVATRFQGAFGSVNAGRVAAGDDPRWSDPQWDDRAWPNALFYTLDGRERIFWARRQVILPARSEDRTLCVYASMIGSFEVYWDGGLIGRSGTIVPNVAAGAPGAIDNFFPIPREAAGGGSHLLAVRVGRPGNGEATGGFQGIAIGDYERMLRSRVVSQVVPLAGCGLFVVIGVYFAAVYLAASRRPSLLVFAVLCFAAALLAVAETWRWMVGYTYDHHALRMTIVTTLTFAIALLLPAFVALELAVSRARIWCAVFAAMLIAVAALPASADDRCLRLFWTAIVLATVPIAVAGRRQVRKRIPVVAAVALLGAALAAGGYGFGDAGFFLAFCGVIVLLLLSLAVELRAERRGREEAQLRAARLEIELLQKTIQPHFVMNTLTAVMEWIEDDPSAALRFLEAFAAELRLFAAISRAAVIPVSQELALCRSHLMVMQCRKGTRFHLHAEGVESSAVIPPALFHTLIENAITHNGYEQEDVRFVLAEERESGRRRYVFDAPMSARAARTSDGEGTGLRYVKARLEESYPGGWRLEAARRGEMWRTTIEVPA